MKNLERDRSSARMLSLAVLVALAASGCYRGGARPVEMSSVLHDSEWLTVSNVPTVLQDGEHECGAAAVAMVLDYWGHPTAPDDVRKASAENPEHGITAGFLRAYLRGQGLRAFLLQGNFDDLEQELKNGRPVLVGVERRFTTGLYAHYQVVVGINRRRKELVVIDPAVGWREYSFGDFEREWGPASSLTLVVSPSVFARE